MFFIVSLIALALALAIAIFGLQSHPVLMVFAFPLIASVYGGLTLIVFNLISSLVGLARNVAAVVAARTRQGDGDHGCDTDDEGENDRSLTTSDTKIRPLNQASAVRSSSS